MKGGLSWPIAEGVPISGQLKANNTLFIKQAALDGRGVALLPNFVSCQRICAIKEK
jgi:DNA-binding transcriptional LysR family regulator